MSQQLKLLPVTVPWQIDPGAPYLTLQIDKARRPSSATFIAYFKCAAPAEKKVASSQIQIVTSPPDFRPASLEEEASFRLLRVHFTEGYEAQMKRAVSDHEVIQEDDYDWSSVSSTPRVGETIEQTVRRSHELWIMAGLCPNPRMYEIESSPRIHELGLSSSIWRQYLLLGHDEYLEVIAQGWTWEAGQSVD
jgi:hypothetical protein